MNAWDTQVDAWLAAALAEAKATPHPTALAASRAQLVWLLALHHGLFPALHGLRQRAQAQRLATPLPSDAAQDVEIGRWMQSLRNALGHLYELPLGWGLTSDQRDAAVWTLRVTTQLKVGLAEAPQAAAEGGLGACELADGLARLGAGLRRLGLARNQQLWATLGETRRHIAGVSAHGWTAPDYGEAQATLCHGIEATAALIAECDAELARATPAERESSR